MCVNQENNSECFLMLISDGGLIDAKKGNFLVPFRGGNSAHMLKRRGVDLWVCSSI